MHSIRLIVVGKIKTPWIAEGCSVFIERLGHQCKFETIVLQAGTKEEENKRLAATLGKNDGVIVLLDERGKEKSSVEFAQWLSKLRDGGEPVTFVIGGAYGLGDDVRTLARETMALSRMTLPHELCQLVFLEQLYRAHAIIAQSGYHH